MNIIHPIAINKIILSGMNNQNLKRIKKFPNPQLPEVFKFNIAENF